MKKIVIILSIFALILGSCRQTTNAQEQTTNAQESTLVVEKKINQYYVDTLLYSRIDFSFTNKSNNNYVLWIEKDDVSSLSESEIIKNYFFTIKGDFSLMGLIWDGNVGFSTPELFISFIRIIKPNEQFVVSIVVKGDVNDKSEQISWLEKQIQIVDVKKIRGFTVNAMTDFFDYKANKITVHYELFNR